MYDNEAVGSFFDDADDYGAVEIISNDYKLEPGTHDVTVSKAGPIDTKNGKKFVIEFTGDEKKGFTQFFDPIEPSDAQKMFGDKSLRQIKMEKRVTVFTSLGVPKDAIKTLDPDSLVGINGKLTIYKKKDTEYMQFGKFVANPATAWVPKGGFAKQEPVKVSVAASTPADLGEFGI